MQDSTRIGRITAQIDDHRVVLITRGGLLVRILASIPILAAVGLPIGVNYLLADSMSTVGLVLAIVLYLVAPGVAIVLCGKLWSRNLLCHRWLCLDARGLEARTLVLGLGIRRWSLKAADVANFEVKSGLLASSIAVRLVKGRLRKAFTEAGPDKGEVNNAPDAQLQRLIGTLESHAARLWVRPELGQNNTTNDAG